MSADLLVPDETRLRQRRAADPAASVWVSANAGAGKTKVLTDRVIRLMLAGTPPARILCLTFTKAAAAEMTIRVFDKLGAWVTMDDARLGVELADLTGERAGRQILAEARRLFARAVETPGGLKIETIHAFCERVLHLVPFEAEVPSRFAVLDDGQAAELRAEARAAILTEAITGGEGRADLARALDIVSAQASGEAMTRLVDIAVADPRVPGDPDEIGDAAERLRIELALAPGETPDAIRRRVIEDGIPASEWPALAAAIRAAGKATDGKRADSLDRAAATADPAGCYVEYSSVFLTEGRARASMLTKFVPAEVKDRMLAEQARIVDLSERLCAAAALERTVALYTLAGAVRAKTVELKRRLGALDFADLISKTLQLFQRGAAPWILYKLDRGIDHVLVDEAQDTNPEQWQILRHLTEEFTAGEGRPASTPRTVFAVGDPKQSIYSFQGADPRLFEESRQHWRSRHDAARLRFVDVQLDVSFRSAPAILGAVDDTFRVASHFQGLSFDDAVTGTAHSSARRAAHGHVEIWPTELPGEADPDPDAWALPVDEPERTMPAVKVASRVAEAVRCWTTRPDAETGRIWHPGDILILARKRGPAFFAVIRALKAAGVPVAGADRIDINEHIAISDLVAAGQAALLPGNDLVLAAVLKSPLVGLDDDDLIRIAGDREEGESLADALARMAPGDAGARNGHEAVAGWRELARGHGPFGFYATLLGPGGGRRRLVERLGGEAADAIDVFLCRAANAEKGGEAPSLTAFLAGFEAAEHVIKRDPEAAGDQVRVMTVHGAKGLEAPLVVVLDGCDVAGRDPELIGVPAPGGEPIPVWVADKASDPPSVAAARAALQAQGREEHNRLLYVALTRARDRLVIAPFTTPRGKEPPEAWCAMVRRGFEDATRALHRTEMPYGIVDLWRDAVGPAAEPRPASSLPELDVPAWLHQPAEPEPEPAPPLRPSGALAAADRPVPSRWSATRRSDARRHGILVHALVDALALLHERERGAAAEPWLAARAPALASAGRERVVADALRVLGEPRLAALFGPGSRGEVAISGLIGSAGHERSVTGQMDRLWIGPSEILVADLKTGAPPADGAVSPTYLAQLAIYRTLLAAIHPDRPVRALLVWTDGPTIVEPDGETLAGALRLALAGLP
ncbi:double-strand break repair helicase AddA [uncultured Enterovirga sp.]|uniref:double-strand break repair helicase AddA n=1 Tax=uncultured Enterovirga sp. TaxID=2026352 RepID=UPI0035CC3A3F